MADSNIFYSWQSDLPNKTNRTFIERALEDAAKEINREGEIENSPRIDSATTGVPGSPDIVATIFSKIDKSVIFVADLSIIDKDAKRPTPNPNVLIELGYALKTLGSERILIVINTAYGEIDLLPFDIKRHRIIPFICAENATTEERSAERKKLQAIFKDGFTTILNELDKSLPGELISPPPFGWRLDEKSFNKGIQEFLRKGDNISLQEILHEMSKDCIQLSHVEEESFDEESIILLDRLMCFAAKCLSSRNETFFNDAIQVFLTIFNSFFDSSGSFVQGISENIAKKIWLNIGLRLMALGAYAVRQQNWKAVRQLVLQIPKDHSFVYRSKEQPWIRFAQMQAARVGLLSGEKGEMLNLAVEKIDAEECLRPDLPPKIDGLLNSLVQFDVLAGLLGILDTGDFGASAFYPNFAIKYSNRSEPILIQLLNNTQMRQIIFEGKDSDSNLAQAIAHVDHIASTQGFLSWDGWEQPQIKKFLKKNLSEEV